MPYANRPEFEFAKFTFTQNQMSAKHIDKLLNIWAATLISHGENPPFVDHEELYATIDSTPLGDVSWETFSVKYNGELPEAQADIPSWMMSEHDVWFRDPRALVHHLLSNPDFDKEFDYAPFQEHDSEGNHRYQNFMSGNWAWKQAVSFIAAACPFNLTETHRIQLLRILLHMDLHLYPLFLVAIRQLFLLVQVTPNTGLCIYLLEIYTIMYDAHIGTGWSFWAFWLF